MSDAEMYQRAKAIFLQAIELPEEERAGFLNESCGDDDELRKEVEELLEHHAEEPVADAASGVDETETMPITPSRAFFDGGAAALPERIGVYRIIRQIGHGGMGVVYLGAHEDGRFRRYAAIKVVKRGMDTEDVLKRFELERQVLSALNHPNIARLYDAGSTEDGRPYFAMEYIEGLPINDYCDRHRLSVDDRLELFRQICSALRYAHQNLVVHRDLKPANIIVTNDGVPKLLDFGIAKLLNPALTLVANDPTAPELRVMTPEYASPEQVRGEQITTASDVYSLGVLLYELLTGHRPYYIKKRLREEIERVICEEEPTRPSTAISRIDTEPYQESGKPPSTRTITPELVSKTRGTKPEWLRRRLAGDLDNIILMAMRKEPQRRYTSVERFLEDIDKHLHGMPVSARPSGMFYRSGKFVKRHKAGVAIAALLLMAITASLYGTMQSLSRSAEQARADMATAQAVAAKRTAEAEKTRADAADAKAETRAMGIRDLVQLLLGDFHDAILRMEGATRARELLVSTALTYLEKLAEEDGSDDPAIVRELATAYDRVGSVQWSVRGASLGDTAAAIESFARARELRQELLDAGEDDSTLLRATAGNHIRMGDARMFTGATELATREYEQALEILERLAAAYPEELQIQRVVAASMNNLGATFARMGDPDAAMRLYQRSLELCRELLIDHPDNPSVQRDLSVSLGRVAGRYEALGEWERAIEYHRDSLVIREQLLATEPHNVTNRRDVGLTNYFLGLIYVDQQMFDEAEHHFDRYRLIATQLAEADIDDARVQQDVMLSHRAWGELLLARGDLDAALASAEQFIALVAPFAEADPSNLGKRRLVAQSHELLADVYAARNQSNESVNAYRKALDIINRLAGADPANAQLRADQVRLTAAIEELGPRS